MQCNVRCNGADTKDVVLYNTSLLYFHSGFQLAISSAWHASWNGMGNNLAVKSCGSQARVGAFEAFGLLSGMLHLHFFFLIFIFGVLSSLHH